MYISQAKLNHFTVFEDLKINFNNGVNVFIGKNGTGKTHILKVLYSACQATNQKVSFSRKIVMTMLPDEYKISRLITRKQGSSSANIEITANQGILSGLHQKNLFDVNENICIKANFNNKTSKWDATVKGEEKWCNKFANTSSIFIPAKEILSNSYNLTAAVEKNNVKFDDTYIDIINSAKVDISLGRDESSRAKLLKKIETIINGKVVFDTQKDEFFLKKGNSKLEFILVAEGIRKLALLWQLVKNGTLEKGSILFWDEPEANINPEYIPVIAEILLELQKSGVQVFVATHDYMLSKYFEIKRSDTNDVLFHSFEKNDTGIEYSFSNKFGDLKNNSIITAFDKLLDEIYDLGV